MGSERIPYLWPLLLIPLFFLTNAANEYYSDLDLNFFARLAGYIFLILIVVAAINLILFRPREKVLAFSIILLLFLLFTKNIFSVLSEWLNRSLYFLVLAIVLGILFFLVRKAEISSLHKFSRGFIFISAVLILFEVGRLGYAAAFPEKNLSLKFTDTPQFTDWTGASKPNIYLILFDEYQGNEGLQQLFGFSNKTFNEFLRQQGFEVVSKPASNYNYTYFSVPSLFSMGYLRYSDGNYGLDYKRVLKSINALNKENQAVNFLKRNGYAVKNFSLFNLSGHRTPYAFDGLDEDAFSVLYARTFPGWLQTDLLHISQSNGVHKAARDLYYQMYDYNKAVLADTKNAIDYKTDGPLFVYSHFLLPHLPVLTDSLGKLRSIGDAAAELHHFKPALKESYLAYAGFANKIFKEIVNHILKHDPQPVIILVSDHGLRRVLGSTWVHDIQLAVKTPGDDSQKFYDGMSLVNLFRILFNKISGQQLKMLPDSTVSVK